MSKVDLGVIEYGQAPILRQPSTLSQSNQEAQACVDEPQKGPVSLESVSRHNNTATIISTPLIEHKPNDGLFARTIYKETKCATCEAPLDDLEELLNFQSPELYCTRVRAADHPAVACSCGEKFQGLKELRSHSLRKFHRPMVCAVPLCGRSPFTGNEVWHFRQHHSDIKCQCNQCGVRFTSKNGLDWHGTHSMHAAYSCNYPSCGSEFSRVDDLVRHELRHKKNAPRHPCPHCRRQVFFSINLLALQLHWRKPIFRTHITYVLNK